MNVFYQDDNHGKSRDQDQDHVRRRVHANGTSPRVCILVFGDPYQSFNGSNSITFRKMYPAHNFHPVYDHCWAKSKHSFRST